MTERQRWISTWVERIRSQREFVERATRDPDSLTFEDQQAYYRARKGVINHDWPLSLEEYQLFSGSMGGFPQVYAAFPKTEEGEVDWSRADVKALMALEQQCVETSETILAQDPTFNDRFDNIQNTFLFELWKKLGRSYSDDEAFYIYHGFTLPMWLHWRLFSAKHNLHQRNDAFRFLRRCILFPSNQWLISSQMTNFSYEMLMHSFWVSSTHKPYREDTDWRQITRRTGELMGMVGLFPWMTMIGVTPWFHLALCLPTVAKIREDQLRSPTYQHVPIAAFHTINNATCYGVMRLSMRISTHRWAKGVLAVSAVTGYHLLIEPIVSKCVYSQIVKIN